GICMERSLEMIIGLLGILKAGGAYVPLDSDYPEERLRFVAEDAGLRVLLTHEATDATVSGAGVERISFTCDATVLTEQEDITPASLSGRDTLAYVIYTSGSTGTPKGVMISHAGICNRLLWMQSEYELGVFDRVLQKTPYTFDVSVWELFWPVLTGATLVMARPEGHKDSAYLVETICR
ncbi:MAG: AMP-binding protein, partial [Planctomycetes bacterium]|nr:AMP-binding protein [Planctomycetota bacterium]